jgi:hypothetical protein
MHIDSYSFGSMTVEGKTYTTDLIIFPDRVRPDWWRVEGHSLCMEDLTEILDYEPEILVIGKGASGCMQIPEFTRKALEEKYIEVIDQNTDEAYRIFKDQTEQDKKVVGAFHLTC